MPDPPSRPPGRPAAPPAPRGGPPVAATPAPTATRSPGEPVTLERLAVGIGRVLIAVEAVADTADERHAALSGRLDRLTGRLDELAELLHRVVDSLPEPERWCPPWLSDDGEVYCAGGYRLRRSPDSYKDSTKKEWMHPLEGVGWSWNERRGEWVEARWHNLYESQALKAPPPEGERPWPAREGEDG